MKKIVILFFSLSCLFKVLLAQQNLNNKTSSIDADLLFRIETNSLSKADSIILKKQPGQILFINKGDTITVALLLRLADHKLSKADSALLKRQINKNDNLKTKINEKGLSEKNQKLDSLELKISSCDFENDANAMILFDVGQMYNDETGIMLVRHKRIKILTEKGKSAANIRIDCTNQFGAEKIEELEGETINFNNGKIEYTPLDPNLIYHESKDKYHDAIIFSLPNVKAGSIIEIGYAWHRTSPQRLPGWDFQNQIPTCYSQFVIQLYNNVRYSLLQHTTFPLAKDSVIFGGLGHVWAMSNVPSFINEPFMRSAADGLQSLQFVLKTLKTPDGKILDIAGSWATVGQQFANDPQLDKTFNQNINDDEGLVKAAKKLITADERVAYLYNQVKTKMKWNQEKNWASKDGLKKAWQDKSGNWGEINMVLCKLLNDAGVKAYPMLVCTRDSGKIYRNFVNRDQINKLVAYVPADSSKFYVLDASNKYNNYNEIPFDLLNAYGLCLDKELEKYELVLLVNYKPVKKEVLINAEIKPNGTMAGTAQINSFSYNKTNALQLYNQLDEKKYMDLLSDNDNNLKILSLKLENAEIDSLPLTQNINFSLNLPGTDDTYIYFNPNLFTGLYINPFINQRRFTDIDFGCNNLFSINGKYKIPDGYKIDALPKSQIITMPDKSIIFKRDVLNEEGYIIVYYVINFKKSFFPKENYFQVYDFFKKLTDLLNEQIVLKKS